MDYVDKYGRGSKIKQMTRGQEMLTKKIMYGLLVGGAFAIAATSPYFGYYLGKKIFSFSSKRSKRVTKQQWNNTFYYMKRRGYLNFEKKNGQIYISLTKEGSRKAGKYAIDDLTIEKPKKWDGKWRIVIFDIPDITRLTREALRGKLIEFGFYKLQQSIWVLPYECTKEIKFIRQFFGLDAKHLQLIVAADLEEGEKLRRVFKLER